MSAASSRLLSIGLIFGLILDPGIAGAIASTGISRPAKTERAVDLWESQAFVAALRQWRPSLVNSKSAAYQDRTIGSAALSHVGSGFSSLWGLAWKGALLPAAGLAHTFFRDASGTFFVKVTP